MQTLDGTVSPSPYTTPGVIGTATGSQKDSEPLGKGGDIWTTEEVTEKQHYEYEDPRPQPDYDIIFKQSVGAEDVFLGMGGKTPATASCEGMVVRAVCVRACVCESDLLFSGQNQTPWCRAKGCTVGHYRYLLRLQDNRMVSQLLC